MTNYLGLIKYLKLDSFLFIVEHYKNLPVPRYNKHRKSQICFGCHQRGLDWLLNNIRCIRKIHKRLVMPKFDSIMSCLRCGSLGDYDIPAG